MFAAPPPLLPSSVQRHLVALGGARFTDSVALVDSSLAVVAVVVAVLASAAAATLAMRASLRRSGRRALLHHRARIDRFKLTRKAYVVEQVLADPLVADAVREHATLHGTAEPDVWRQVHRYLDEIVPFFNVLAYFRLGYPLSRALLSLFYKLSVEYERPDPFRGLPRDSIVLYVMNHRSNADYVVVAYVLMGDVSISYAVGEWARAFPLEYLFKSFGSYFVRRRYREPLYHAVLAAYVRLITRNGVTQGVFPEGRLTRDGRLGPAKIGLLDYFLSVTEDPACRGRMYVVPVAVNFDRVLEDRSLLRELETASDRPVVSRGRQAAEVSRFLFWNLGRLAAGRWRRYGRAAVSIGLPVPVDDWLIRLEAEGVDLFALPRPERLAHVQEFADGLMRRIGAIIPVTPVPLACAALQSFDAEFVARDRLLERMAAMRDVLVELNGRVLRADRDIAETFDRAYRMLRMRRVLARSGAGYAILPKGRPLISYYANSIAHLLGPFADGVRARDALPVEQALASGRPARASTT